MPPAFAASVEAALLSELAARVQIIGGIVDGRPAMDGAVSPAAARTTGITAVVAGRANVPVAPGPDAVNLPFKQRALNSHANRAGCVFGPTVAVIFHSRPDSAMSRLAFRAVAALHQESVSGADTAAPAAVEKGAPMDMTTQDGKTILTLNAGSSSLKIGVFSAEPAVLATGLVDRIGGAGSIRLRAADGTDLTLPEGLATDFADHAGALDTVLAALRALFPARDVVAVGHRVVHGGPDRDGPIRIDADALADLAAFAPFAPLHQPHNLAGITAAMAAFPDAVQVACFDTAFHRSHPFVNDTFALPRALYAKGVRRYGFHGLSYDYIAGALARDWPGLAGGRVIVAHLGNGASMCALKAGRSVASTMGFSALDGLPMGTRCGQLDPGVVLYLMEQEGMDAAEISDMLYRRSGLLGMSDLSNDMRTLEAATTEGAREAIDYFVFRVQRELGGLSAALRGLDGLVFCGGIGENSRTIRARVAEGMDWLGVRVDPERNAANGPVLSPDGAPVTVLTIPTDEEIVIARATAALARHATDGQGPVAT